MPVILGPFETSLRGGDSPHVDRKVLHKGCCGTLHGHGVRKERSVRDLPKASRACDHSTTSNSSSDESSSELGLNQYKSRAHSSDCAKLQRNEATGVAKSRSSSAVVVAQRLFSSPTKSVTAKYRAERTASDGRAMNRLIKGMNNSSMSRLHHKSMRLDEHDSGNFSSDTDTGNFTSALMKSEGLRLKQSLIHGVSDDEEELRLQRRKRMKEFAYRTESPSPARTSSGAKKKQPYEDRGQTSSDEISSTLAMMKSEGARMKQGLFHSDEEEELRLQRQKRTASNGKKKQAYGGTGDDRGRRSSDEFSSTSSTSPPATPSPRSYSNNPNSGRMSWETPTSSRRTLSQHPNNAGKRTGGVTRVNYAFGSSVSRFDKSEEKQKASKINYSKHHSVAKTSSLGNNNNSSNSHNNNSGVAAKKDQVAKAWLQFKEDVEAAMQKKPPGGKGGFYKNLSEMMHSKKMELLDRDEVGRRSFY